MASNATSLKESHISVTPDKSIEFPSVLYTSVQGSIKLTNINENKQTIAFKIKTTAPKKYLVRPSAGIIKHNEHSDVQIILQANDETTCGNNKNASDRFLIQTCILENSMDFLDKNFWLNVDKSKIQDKRLSVVFKDNNEMNQHDDFVNSMDRNNCMSTAMSSNKASAGFSTSNNIFHPVSANPSTSSKSNFNALGENASSVDKNNVCISNNNATSSIFASSAIIPNELKQKYEELVQYCLAVEKQKNILQKENELLKHKCNAQNYMQNDAQNAVCTSSRSFLELWHIFPLLLGAFFLAKIFGYL